MEEIKFELEIIQEEFKEIDFLNLFINDIDYLNEMSDECINTKREVMKYTYTDLMIAISWLNSCINSVRNDTLEKKYKEKLLEVKKYLFNQKLNKKLVVKNTKTKTIKI